MTVKKRLQFSVFLCIFESRRSYHQTGHDFKDNTVQPIENLIYSNEVTRSFMSKSRCMSNSIRQLQTSFLFVLNDNIYPTGNISENQSIELSNIQCPPKVLEQNENISLHLLNL